MAIRWSGKELKQKDSAGLTDDSNDDFSGGLQQGYELGSLTDGLIAYYPFDGDVQDKALDNDGTDNTSAGFVSGKMGKAKDFDGDDDVSVPVSIGRLITDNITLSAWVKVDVSDNGYGPIFGARNSGGGREFYQSVNADPANGWYLYGNIGGSTYDFDKSIPTDEWHLITMTYEGSTVKMYCDGSLYGSKNLASSISSFSEAYVGYDGNGKYFDGSLDDVRIYDRALSQPEIKALYQRTSTQKITDKDRLTSGLVGHWPLNEDSSGKAYDLSGRGLDSTSVTGTSTAVGLGGAKARKFDGSDDYIDLGVKPLEGLEKATMSVFVVFDSFDSQNVVFQARGSSWDDAHGISHDTNGTRIVASVNNGGSTVSVEEDVSNYSEGEWYRLAFTFDSGELTLYRNGSEIGKNTGGPSKISSNASNLMFGRADGAGRYHKGRIADGRVYNRVLSKSEIQKLAEMGGL